MTAAIQLPLLPACFDPGSINTLRTQQAIPVTHIAVDEPVDIQKNSRAYWQEVFMQRLTPDELTRHAQYSQYRAAIALSGVAERVANDLGHGAEILNEADVCSEDFWHGLVRGTSMIFTLDREIESLKLRVREDALVEAVASRATDVGLKQSLGNTLLTLRLAELIATKGVSPA